MMYRRLACGWLHIGEASLPFGSSSSRLGTEERQRTVMEDSLSPLIHILLSPKSPANADMVNLYPDGTSRSSQHLLVKAFGALHIVSNAVPSVEPK
ncbi:hypothetical protein L195_g048315 [Trifolium pratense]|uniref:Uncharacterized protein n=1 Tax=Trifolium pratense TaxID=57577 RepID=A0A2K3JL01_TRIPR|nr:hypothetical protein L195_g048315 [Trifolium pratense]